MRVSGFLILFLSMAFLPTLSHAQERLLVFAAASQRDAMQEVGRQFEGICGCRVVFSFAATSTLARQIDVGAKADVFVSANEAWADWLEIRGRLVVDTRSVVAGNRLVIASTENNGDGFEILSRGRFAMADPVSVPAGIYAREALEKMGVWDDARGNAVFSENVRVALSSVARGDLLSGIVYQSDLRLAPELTAHLVFPTDSHSPIHYVASAVKGVGSGPEFVEFLRSDIAQDIFQRFGFLPVKDMPTQ